MIVTDEGIKRYTIQFIDISSRIFYDELKAQEQFTTLYTSSISHEMRNPLNSIMSQCKILEHNLQELVNYLLAMGVSLSAAFNNIYKRIVESN